MTKKFFFFAIFIWLIFGLTSCYRSSNNFKQFSGMFIDITLPFSTTDSIEFLNQQKEQLIDSNFVTEFLSVSNFQSSEFSLQNMREYECRYIGKFTTTNCVVLFYKLLTSSSGNGNPKLIMATFSKSGKKVSEQVVLWTEAFDPFYHKRIYLDVLTSDVVLVNSVTELREIKGDELVIKTIFQDSKAYSVHDNGKVSLIFENKRTLSYP